MAKRKIYSLEFKREAVQLMRKTGTTVAQVARDLGLSETALRHWEEKLGKNTPIKQASEGPETEHQELVRLRREVKVLRMEREILKKATAFFAKESP